jgi:ABC-type antimicrobial peptide transport system permease subunit
VRFVRLFFWIAVLILLIACINFMNLATARSQKRIIEVGVRKTFGAGRMRLIRQFLTEAGTITLISLLFAGIFIVLILPQFNILTGKQLTFGFDNPVHWGGLVCIGFICSILAGGYPAFFLSSFPPTDVLQKLQTRTGIGVVWLRKGMVVFQFVASLTLIICTAFIYLQVQHAKNRSLGMDIEQVLMVVANNDVNNHCEVLKQELLSTGVVENIGFSDNDMLNIGNNGGGWKWQGKPDNIDPLVSFGWMSDGLLPTLNITMFAGRNYDESTDCNSDNVIINKSFADLMGEEGRIGGRLWREGDGWREDCTIIGIINDFVYNNIYSMKQKPALLRLEKTANFLFIRLKSGDTQLALQKVENVMKQIDPNHPFEYTFMDDRFQWQFSNTLLVGKLVGLFAALAIFISCLGLFGLTAFSAEQRTREIGIRKVMGATVMNIVELLGRNFLLLIGIAFVIALPLSWWIIYEWLQKFEYRIPINWWVFAGSGVLVVLIAMLTVGFLATKAAMTNPIKAIKVE